jgi:hypothetical protein
VHFTFVSSVINLIYSIQLILLYKCYDEKSVWHTRYFIPSFGCLFTNLISKSDPCCQDTALFKAAKCLQEENGIIPYIFKQRKLFLHLRNAQGCGSTWFIFLPLLADGCCQLIVANWNQKCRNISDVQLTAFLLLLWIMADLTVSV